MTDTPHQPLSERLQELVRATGDDLDRQAALAARLTGAEHLSIMLVGDDDDGHPERARMTVSASFGPLPAAARTAAVAAGEGLAGRVLASGEPLLIADLAASPYAHLARRPDDPRRSVLLVPVRVGARVVGTVNASCSSTGCFGEDELGLLEVVALLAGKTMQLRQLQGILASRFAQLALLQAAPASPAGYQQPDRIARLLARTFYREMAKAGFSTAQVVQAASEIIAQLNGNLARHGRRTAEH